MPDLHPDVTRWLGYLAQRNRSPSTIRSYSSTMRTFHPDPCTATIEDVEAWWQSLDGLSVNTRTRSLSCVRSFYTWAARFDLVTVNPTRRLDPPHRGRKLPQPISRADLHRLLGGADPEMRRALCLGAYAGLRVSEAAVLNWTDVDLESRRIIVRGGKGDKDRAVGLSVLLLDALLPNTGGNVVTAGGSAYSAASLQRKINRAIRRAGVDATFHRLRARYATVALAGTGNLLAVSRALGHSSPATTAASYALSADSDLDLIAEAVTR